MKILLRGMRLFPCTNFRPELDSRFSAKGVLTLGKFWSNLSRNRVVTHDHDHRVTSNEMKLSCLGPRNFYAST